MIIPVILSGGSGTRLWPLSRKHFPKQLLALAGDGTMLQNTVSRLSGIVGITSPIIVCNNDHRFMVAEQMREMDVIPHGILLEPVGRNTAPAACIAALEVLAGRNIGNAGEEVGGEAGQDEAVLLVLPADHVISDVDAFHRAVETGAGLAADGKLVTFGIVPTGPETGYGYIRVKKAGRDAEGTDNFYEVERFVEKPEPETAREYLASGDYYWNSGMFMFRASVYLEELERFEPAMLEACRRAVASRKADMDFIRFGEEAFRSCPEDSIDYAVMEKTSSAVVIPLEAGWNDVGSWSALWEIGTRNGEGNVIEGDVLVKDSRNCYLHATSRMLAVVGLEDHVVVETSDAVLVAPRDRVQDVKSIVTALKDDGREEAVLHRRVYRPWGSYEGVDVGDRFQVKRIVVKPGAVLSLQMHHHRAEHWIVVKGTARITKGEETFLLSENQSTYIPIGEKHRLENPGAIPLELVEVQSGSYLGEDDIVRYDDRYGREGTNS